MRPSMIHPTHLHGMHMTVIAKDGWDQTTTA
jgi:FtsP/CotA-like multicopper oxidase with cupredoxin domain